MLTTVAFTDGTLVRLAAGPDLWMVIGDRRVRVGASSSNVLAVLRRSPTEVVVVDEATLASLPTAPLPSATDIPGSLAYPPLNDQFGSELGRHFVIRTEPTTRVFSQGKELRSITLRGWLHPLPPGDVNNQEGGWDDWHYWLDLDTAWAVGVGVDLNAVIRIGNFAEHMHSRVAGSDDFYTWAGTAYIHLEINGWKAGNSRGVPRPSGWAFDGVPGFNNPFPGTVWPFDPRFPASDRDPPYVEVSGSLIADRSHVPGTGSPARHAVGWWQRGISNDSEESPVRAAEIHPPDQITVLPPVTKTENLYGVAVVAASGLFDQHRQEIDALLTAPGAPPTPAHYARAVEHVGPESYLDSLVLSNAARTGAEVRIVSDSAVRVRAAVEARLWGRLGKFKALYRVFWARVSVEEMAASGFVVFFPPTVMFRLRSPQRPTLTVRLEVRYEDRPWKVVVSEDPFGGTGAIVRTWHPQPVQSNTGSRLFCFWLGRTADRDDFKGLDGRYTFRLTVLRFAGGVAATSEATTTIRWGWLRVTCARHGRTPDGRRRIVALGGSGWMLPAEAVISRIEAGARFFVEQPAGDSVQVVVATSALGQSYLKTEADGNEPNNLLSLPTCP
jgi:hypothetical protein